MNNHQTGGLAWGQFAPTFHSAIQPSLTSLVTMNHELLLPLYLIPLINLEASQTLTPSVTYWHTLPPSH